MSPSAIVERRRTRGRPRRCRRRRRARPRAEPGDRRQWRAAADRAWRWRATMASRSGRVMPARSIAVIAASRLSMATDCSGPRDAALPDAGALHDPLVGGVQGLAEVGVGDDRRVAPRRRCRPSRQRGAASCPAAASRWANSAPMCLLRSASTACTATRIAFLMAFAGEAPWQMMETPSPPAAGPRRTRSSRGCGTAPRISGRRQHVGQLSLRPAARTAGPPIHRT